jgi:hypothetical protein
MIYFQAPCFGKSVTVRGRTQNQDMAFFQQHGLRILASGESVPEVLRIFNALPVIIDEGS